MQIYSRSKKYILVLDGIIILLCFAGFYGIINKAGLPFNISVQNSDLTVSGVKYHTTPLNAGNKIISINGFEFQTREEVELYLDGLNPGDTVIVKYSRYGNTGSVLIELVKFYDVLYNICALFIGGLFIIIAVLVIIKCFGHLFLRGLLF